MNRSADALIVATELRHRRGSLATLGLLVAVVTGAVLTATVGAHRSATAVDRFRAWAHSSDLEYQSNEPDSGPPMLAAAQGDPGVQRATLRYLVNVWPADGSPDLAVRSDPGGRYGRSIDRPVVLRGRMPRPDAPDEILLNELAATVSKLDVGDTVEVNSWSAEDLGALFGGGEFPGFNGPKFRLTVVGVGRTADGLSGTVRRTSPYAIGSAAFLGAHPGIGAWPPVVVVEARPGADLASLDRAMSKVQAAQALASEAPPGGFQVAATQAEDIYLRSARTSTRSLVAGLLMFAAAALLAGGLALSQAVQRQLADSATQSTTLSALGMTRNEVARARSWPLALAALVGVVVGVAGAIAASPLLPIGLVAQAERQTGVWVDPAVLASGAVLVVAAVWGWAFAVARRQVSDRPGSATARRVPWASRLAARSSVSAATGTGLRLAGDRGRGPAAVPVRSAFVGVAVAVTGVVAASVVATSFADLSTTPAWWGVPWSSMPDNFGNPDRSADDLVSALSGDDRVEAVARYTVGSLILGGRPVTASVLDHRHGTMDFTVIDGRLPRSPTEIALGERTLRDVGTRIGDTVPVLTSDGSRRERMTVVGTVVLPATDEFSIDIGAVTQRGALDRYGQNGDMTESLVVRYPDGADVAAVEAHLTKVYGLGFNLFTETRPQGSVTSLADPRDIALALAAFLVVIGLIGMAHALVVTSRRRGRDLGVLRALGLRAVEAGRAMSVAALALTVAGLVVGVPLGLVAGRGVWRALVTGLGTIGDPGWPWWSLALVVPAAAGAALVLAWWPAHHVRRRSPADALRVE